MSDLVKLVDGQPMADSLTISELFDRQHKNVMQAVENLDCSDEFRGLNFQLSTYRPENGRRDYPLYNLTRDGFTFLVMGFTGEKAAQWKEAYIAAFNEMERTISRGPDLNDPAQLRNLLSDYAGRMIEMQSELDEAQPKLEAHERIAEADGSLCVTDAAKALQMGPKALFSYLNEHGWIYKRAGASHWLGYQAKVTSGLLEHKVTTVLRPDGTEKITEQVRITPKGLSKLALLIPPSAEAA